MKLSGAAEDVEQPVAPDGRVAEAVEPLVVRARLVKDALGELVQLLRLALLRVRAARREVIRARLRLADARGERVDDALNRVEGDAVLYGRLLRKQLRVRLRLRAHEREVAVEARADDVLPHAHGLLLHEKFLRGDDGARGVFLVARPPTARVIRRSVARLLAVFLQVRVAAFAGLLAHGVMSRG